MKKLVGYKIITEWMLNLFESELIKYVADGWELYGSPFAIPNKNGTVRFYQAIVKYELD